MTDAIPFRRRFGIDVGPPTHDDFPSTSRIALYHVLTELRNEGQIADWDKIGRELDRLSRVLPDGKIDSVRVRDRLQQLHWPLVFEFCELIHDKLLTPEGYIDHEGEFIERVPLRLVRTEFATEVNRILYEDNIPFTFVEGRFTRPGGKHYQSVAADATRVLGRPELMKARIHYIKAMRFRDAVPHADPENAVKEAVAAIESAVASLFPDLRKGDLADRLKQLRGTTDTEIPPSLASVVSGVYAFRGAGEGVAHGGATGGIATPEVAEFVLSVVAAGIVYLVSLADRRAAQPPF